MKKQNQGQCEAPKPTQERLILEEVAGKWWHCETLGIYCRNAYCATCECASGWVLVTDAEKEAADEKRRKEWEEQQKKLINDGIGV